MHNHYHVVLFIDKSTADNWDALEVVERRHWLFSGTLYSQRFFKDAFLAAAEQASLNASIARMANREDDALEASGESVFSSQALLDEKALAACSTYVDLNPISAGIGDSLTDSDHTSIKRRCEQAAKADQPNAPQQQTDGLHPFAGNPRHYMPNGLPFWLTDYLELADWTGRILRYDKLGAIPESSPQILQQLNIDPKHWCYLSQNFESEFKSLVGTS